MPACRSPQSAPGPSWWRRSRRRGACRSRASAATGASGRRSRVRPGSPPVGPGRARRRATRPSGLRRYAKAKASWMPPPPRRCAPNPASTGRGPHSPSPGSARRRGRSRALRRHRRSCGRGDRPPARACAGACGGRGGGVALRGAGGRDRAGRQPPQVPSTGPRSRSRWRIWRCRRWRWGSASPPSRTGSCAIAPRAAQRSPAGGHPYRGGRGDRGERLGLARDRARAGAGDLRPRHRHG